MVHFAVDRENSSQLLDLEGRLVSVQPQHWTVYQCCFVPNLYRFWDSVCFDDLCHGCHFYHDESDPEFEKKIVENFSSIFFRSDDSRYKLASAKYKLRTLLRRGERDRRRYLSRERDGDRERLRDLEYERERDRRLRLLLTKSSGGSIAFGGRTFNVFTPGGCRSENKHLVWISYDYFA